MKVHVGLYGISVPNYIEPSRYSSEYEWEQTMGGCTAFSGYPLWSFTVLFFDVCSLFRYADWDDDQSFSDSWAYHFGGISSIPFLFVHSILIRMDQSCHETIHQQWTVLWNRFQLVSQLAMEWGEIWAWIIIQSIIFSCGPSIWMKLNSFFKFQYQLNTSQKRSQVNKINKSCMLSLMIPTTRQRNFANIMQKFVFRKDSCEGQSAAAVARKPIISAL